jgi:hypothetical protein
MEDFNLRRFLVEGRLEEGYNDDKDDFGFFFPPKNLNDLGHKDKAEAIFKENNIDYNDGGMFIIDFRGKNQNWRELMDLLTGNGIHSHTTYTY